MKIDVTQKVINIRTGNPFVDAKEQPTNLRWILCEALEGRDPNENIESKLKYERHQLINRILSNDVCEMSIEEIALLKQLVGKFFWVPVVRPVFDLLEKGE